jgi:type I restriction enzyme R subunit
MPSSRPADDYRVLPREQTIKEAIYRILPDVAEVERVFLIIKAQQEY